VSGTDPLGDGSARLRWDQSDINKLYFPAPPPPTLTPFPAYRLMVARAGKAPASGSPNVQAYINAGQDNVIGGMPSGVAADIDYDFTDNNPNTQTPPAVPPLAVVSPNGGTYNPNGNRTQGIVLVGPEVPTSGGRFPKKGVEF